MHAAMLWVEGRYGGFYGKAREVGVLIGVLVPAFFLAATGIRKQRFTIWWGVFAISAISQILGGDAATWIFMKGFQSAVLTAASPATWEMIPQKLDANTAFLKAGWNTNLARIDNAKLPDFAGGVFKHNNPTCYMISEDGNPPAECGLMMCWNTGGTWISGARISCILIKCPPESERMLANMVGRAQGVSVRFEHSLSGNCRIVNLEIQSGGG